MAKQEAEISSGSITVTGSYCAVEAEGGPGSDDLTEILGGAEGQVLVLEAQAGSTITVTSAATIRVNASGTRVLTDVDADANKLTLQFDGTRWYELAFSTPSTSA